jgi:hypothetical protein
VNINQTSNVANIQPGYVIRLPALRSDAPEIVQAPERINREALAQLAAMDADLIDDQG